MRTFIGPLLSVVLLTCAFTACTEETAYRQYQAVVAKELADGQRVDSLFFDIHFGMSSKEFFAHCWEMNKKGLFTDGENNTAVLYKLHNGELPYPASMNFYPAFSQDKICQMSVNFQYDAWAPWNKHLFADSLQLSVLELYKTWYKRGSPFMKLDDEKRGTIYVKVDGNRRIIIGKYDDSRVKVDYTDLRVEKEMEERYGKR
jgi:hypothetical protein